jgi:hypothetical protein
VSNKRARRAGLLRGTLVIFVVLFGTITFISWPQGVQLEQSLGGDFWKLLNLSELAFHHTGTGRRLIHSLGRCLQLSLQLVQDPAEFAELTFNGSEY